MERKRILLADDHQIVTSHNVRDGIEGGAIRHGASRIPRVVQ